MLELYNNINSVCAQKVRIALAEKGQDVKEHLLTLRGDQNEPALSQAEPEWRRSDSGPRRTFDHRVLADPVLHRRSVPESSAHADRMPLPAPSGAALQQADRRISAQQLHYFDLRHGVSAEFSENVARGVAGRDQQGAAETARGIQAQRDRAWPRFGIRRSTRLRNTRSCCRGWPTSLKRGPFLAGDAFSNADCAVIPYILRLELLKLGGMWEQYPAVRRWWARMRERPSVKSRDASTA